MREKRILLLTFASKSYHLCSIKKSLPNLIFLFSSARYLFSKKNYLFSKKIFPFFIIIFGEGKMISPRFKPAEWEEKKGCTLWHIPRELEIKTLHC